MAFYVVRGFPVVALLFLAGAFVTVAFTMLAVMPRPEITPEVKACAKMLTYARQGTWMEE